MLRVLILGSVAVATVAGLTAISPLFEGNFDATSSAVAAAVSAAPETPHEEIRYQEIPTKELFPELPSCVIGVNPASAFIEYPVSIAWGSENAISAVLSDVGSVPVRGGMFLSPRESTTYTLTVRSEEGEVSSCSTRIAVY